jgi:hypothetical protein
MTFYQQYQVLWPELFVTAEMPGDRMAGYRQQLTTTTPAAKLDNRGSGAERLGRHCDCAWGHE